MSIKIQAAQRLKASKEEIRAERATGLGAGAHIFAEDTGNFLYVKRSLKCDEPNTWCNAGGGIEEGETVEEGLKRELMEELGYTGDLQLHQSYVSKQPNFTYKNHLGIIPNEFEPKLNNEHTEHVWLPPGEYPEPMHPKFQESLDSPYMKLLISKHCMGWL